MRHFFLKTAIAAIILFPVITSAASSGPEEIFKKSCVKAWMERAGNTPDKDEFQNFGERYCACAAGKPLNNDAEMDKAARTCISQTLLHTTMNTLENDKGLTNMTEADIEKACQNKWKVVYPGMSNSAQQRTNAYCKCAASQLISFNKNKAKVTDKQWTDKIDATADVCSTKTQR